MEYDEKWYSRRLYQRQSFTELRDGELLRERIQTLDAISNYVGEYFSKEWIKKNILHLSDEDIETMNKQMSDEGEGQEDDTEEEQPTEEKFELRTVAQ